MGFIFFGIKKATIGIDEFLMKCPSCEGDQYADGIVTSNYYHIYHIPIFPFEKEVTLICQTCGLKRYDVPFTPVLFRDYHEIKNKYRHPWYTYSFLLVVLLLIVSAIINSVT